MGPYTIRTHEGIELGPLGFDQLEEQIRQGRVKATSVVFTQETNRWHLAASLPEVREAIQKYHPSQISTIRRIRPTDSVKPGDSRVMKKSGAGSKVMKKSQAAPEQGTPPSTAAPAAENLMELYTVRASNGVEYGPCNIEQLKELVKQGLVKATTMVFTQSSNRWHLAASIAEVRAFLRQYNPSQNSALNRIRALGTSNLRDSAHAMMTGGRVSTVRNIKLPFWKRLFSR